MMILMPPFKIMRAALIMVVLLTVMLLPYQPAFAGGNTDGVVTSPPIMSWEPLEGIQEGAEVSVLKEDPETGASEVLIRLPAGYLFPHHSHTSPEILFWSEGEFTYIADDGTQQSLGPNTYLNLPPGTKHSVLCGQHPCLVYARYDGPFDLLLSPSPSAKQ